MNSSWYAYYVIFSLSDCNPRTGSLLGHSKMFDLSTRARLEISLQLLPGGTLLAQMFLWQTISACLQTCVISQRSDYFDALRVSKLKVSYHPSFHSIAI